MPIMNKLFPIIRRKRKPLIEVAPPAPVKVEPVKPAVATPPVAPEKITTPGNTQNGIATESE